MKCEHYRNAHRPADAGNVCGQVKKMVDMNHLRQKRIYKLLKYRFYASVHLAEHILIAVGKRFLDDRARNVSYNSILSAGGCALLSMKDMHLVSTIQEHPSQLVGITLAATEL